MNNQDVRNQLVALGLEVAPVELPDGRLAYCLPLTNGTEVLIHVYNGTGILALHVNDQRDKHFAFDKFHDMRTLVELIGIYTFEGAALVQA